MSVEWILCVLSNAFMGNSREVKLKLNIVVNEVELEVFGFDENFIFALICNFLSILSKLEFFLSFHLKKHF